jgi:peptidyl-prolyl cis-trans isomerase D
MISFIRSLINSRFGAIIALIFVGLVAIAFVLGDVTGSGSFGGLTNSNVAKVSNQNVTVGELEKAVKNRFKSERQQNPTLDMNSFVEKGGFDSTLDQIINRYALALFGEKYGMAISKRLVDYEIRQIPGAKSADGKFSQIAFDRFLSANGLDEKTLRTDISQNLYAEQMLPIAEKGPAAPDRFAMTYASLLLEKRTGEVTVIPSQAFLPKDPPNEAVLAKYYRDNADKFTVPEKRAVSYAFFDKSIIGNKAKPTANDIAAYYKANEAKYSAGETRNISQIIVPTEAAAKTVVEKIAGGQSIASVAGELGLDVTLLQDQTRDALTKLASKTVADASFAAPSGGVAVPTKASLGWYVIKVDAIKKTGAKTLLDATPEIEAKLAADKQASVLNTITSEIEDELAGGKTIADMAKEQGLQVETTPKLFATGQNPTDPNYRPIAEMQRILPAAFQLDGDGDAQLVEIVPGERYAMVSVAEIEEAAPPPLDKVRDVIIGQWAVAQGSAKAKIAAQQITKAVNAGTALRDAIAGLKIQIPPSQTISGTRSDLRQEGKQLPPPLALLFSMKQGSAKELAAPNDAGWFIVNLKQIVKGDATGKTEMLGAAKKEVSQLMQQEQGQQFIRLLGKDVGIKKYDSVIAELRARLIKRNDSN